MVFPRRGTKHPVPKACLGEAAEPGPLRRTERPNLSWSAISRSPPVRVQIGGSARGYLGVGGPLSSPGMAYWMVACSVYFILYIATSGANVRFCGHIARVGRSVVLAAGHGGGGGLPARMSARRGASGNRCRPAMRRTRSRCAGAGYPGRGDEQRASRGSEHAQHRQVGESHCPVGPGAGSFRHSHRPSSEDTFRGDTPE